MNITNSFPKREDKPLVLNGYRLLAPFQNNNAGFCRWTFGEKEGTEFFIKEYVSPVYPGDSISDELKTVRVLECEKFEAAKTKLYDAVNAASNGNSVRIRELFRCGSHYYSVSERIRNESISFEDLAACEWKSRLIFCRSIAHTVLRLHHRHVVHADIKDTNILILRNQAGALVPKLIDFDCAFFEETPPQNEDELGGDQVYLSPEACIFLCGEPAVLSCKMDIFSLGLLFHQILAGCLPMFDRNEYDYAHEAVLNGGSITLSDQLTPETKILLSRMLECKPEKRIGADELFDELGKIILGEAYVRIFSQRAETVGSNVQLETRKNEYWHRAHFANVPPLHEIKIAGKSTASGGRVINEDR